MDGEPVWLCSVSHWSAQGEALGTAKWRKRDFKRAKVLAHAELEGVGDPSRERAFRMNVTFCIHRALSDVEKTRLPAEWKCAPGGLAGGPVQVLWSNGIEHRDASMPCKHPHKQIIDRLRPDLWVPVDCGECEPCRARAAIAEKGAAKVRA